MSSKSGTVKPLCNKYDNIWEIRQGGSPSPERVEQVLTQKSEWPVRTSRLGKGIIYSHVENFLYAAAKASKILELKVWKIMCPDLDKPEEGSIYYIVTTKQSNKQRNRICKATYGYWGEGPHQAALIEACFEKLGLKIEVRDGDYLLSLGFF